MVRPDRGDATRRKLTLDAVLGVSALGACWLMSVAPDRGFDRYHLPKELWLACCALACSLWWMGRARERAGEHAGPPRDAISGWVLTSLGMAALSTAFATSPALALRALSLQLAASVLFLAARTLPPSRANNVLGFVVAAAAGVALIALGEGLALVTGLSLSGRTPGATLGQRNVVGHLLVLSCPSAWYLAANARRALLRSLAYAASALFGAALLLTRSRAAWLGLAVSALAYLAVQGVRLRRSRTGAEPAAAPAPSPPRAWPTAAAPSPSSTSTRAGLAALLLPLACSLAGALLMGCLPSRLAWTSATPYADTLRSLADVSGGSGAGRLAQYRASLALVPLHPLLGTGPGNWFVEYPRVSPSGDPAFKAHTWLHTGRLANSDWIAMLTEQGAFSLALHLTVAWLVLRQAWRGPWGALAWATAAGVAVVGALDAVLQLPAAACLCALVFGLATPARADARSMPTLLTLALAAALVLGGLGAAGRLAAFWSRTQPAGGYFAAERALRWNPADLSARFTLAEAYALRGDCTRARVHLEALRRLLPYHRSLRALGCLRGQNMVGPSAQLVPTRFALRAAWLRASTGRRLELRPRCSRVSR